jgi:hypothetical protein
MYNKILRFAQDDRKGLSVLVMDGKVEYLCFLKMATLVIVTIAPLHRYPEGSV